MAKPAKATKAAKAGKTGQAAGKSVGKSAAKSTGKAKSAHLNGAMEPERKRSAKSFSRPSKKKR